MQDLYLIRAGALNMLCAVAAGAFGAHALKALLSAEMLAAWHTAVTYQMVHALALLLIAALLPRLDNTWLRRAAIAMLAGILLFSGSLYTLALSGVRLLGVITPIGGVAFLLGWAMLAWAAWRQRK